MLNTILCCNDHALRPDMDNFQGAGKKILRTDLVRHG